MRICKINICQLLESIRFYKNIKQFKFESSPEQKLPYKWTFTIWLLTVPCHMKIYSNFAKKKNAIMLFTATVVFHK